MSDNLKDWLKSIISAIVIAVAILQFIQPTVISGPSMENTLQDKDYVFISKQSYKLFKGSPAYGDIVVFKSNLLNSNGNAKNLIKRVIGVAGDTVSISGGTVYLNGNPLEESYTKDGYTASDMEEITVPEGCIFVLGDNRQNSADSRSSAVGCISIDDIKGKVILRLLPLNKFGAVE